MVMWLTINVSEWYMESKLCLTKPIKPWCSFPPSWRLKWNLQCKSRSHPAHWNLQCRSRSHPAHLQCSLSASLHIPVLILQHTAPADSTGEGVGPAPAGGALVSAGLQGELPNTAWLATGHRGTCPDWKNHPQGQQQKWGNWRGIHSFPQGIPGYYFFISKRRI